MFSVDVFDLKYNDSSWVVTEPEARHFLEITLEHLSVPSFVKYLELRLDEDRSAGEWENALLDI